MATKKVVKPKKAKRKPYFGMDVQDAIVRYNALDSVSDRDFIIDFISNSSILMSHLSRFSEEIIIWCSTIYNFIELDDEVCTGSSIMPQKKNPDAMELVRAKASIIIGNLSSIQNVMKGLPLTYSKDLQEDKSLLKNSSTNLKLNRMHTNWLH